jgi:hypothetical protein
MNTAYRVIHRGGCIEEGGENQNQSENESEECIEGTFEK